MSGQWTRYLDNMLLIAIYMKLKKLCSVEMRTELEKPGTTHKSRVHSFYFFHNFDNSFHKTHSQSWLQKRSKEIRPFSSSFQRY